MRKIVIVDKNDNIIKYKDRCKIKSKDIYRVSALWIKNSKGEVLLAQRSLTKKNNPGKWGPAVAGTVELGESYKKNIIKETEEELGLKKIMPKKGLKIRTTGKHNHFTQWYILEIDKEISEFKIKKDEVNQIKWQSKKELLSQLNLKPELFLECIKECIRW